MGFSKLSKIIKSYLKASWLYPIYLKLRSSKLTLKNNPLFITYANLSVPLYIWVERLKFRTWNNVDTKRLHFYKQFINSGDIVFDVGANIGNRTKIFLKLGAKVIAFEPQQQCINFLDSVLKKNQNFTLVKKALGSEQGEQQMFISSAHTLSSLSQHWINSITDSGRFNQYHWDQKQIVSIDTLDHMIKIHGHPVFIKIDVEGFELEVLSGLSSPVSCISIEFTPEVIASTYKCIDYLQRLSSIECQISIGESMEFELDKWVTPEQIKDRLSKIDPNVFGDIYIRSISD